MTDPTEVIPVCPECGQPQSGLDDYFAAIRRRWSRAGAAIGLLSLVTLLIATSRLSRFSSSGELIPQIVLPGFTAEDLRAIADGRAEPPGAPSLARALLAASEPINPDQPGQRQIVIAFTDAAFARGESFSFGWPTPWLGRIKRFNYEDAVRREGFTPAVTDGRAAPYEPFTLADNPRLLPVRPRLAWEAGTVFWRRPPEETAGLDTEVRVRPIALIPGLAVVLLCGLITAQLARARSARATRRTAALAMGVSALLVLAAAALTAENKQLPLFPRPNMAQVGTPPGPIAFRYVGFTPLSIDRAGVEALSGRGPAGDAELARTLVSEAGPSESDDGRARYLAATALIESMVDERFSAAWYSRAPYLFQCERCVYVRRPEFGAGPIPAPRGLSIRGRAGCAITFAFGDGPAYRVLVSPELPALLFIFALAGAFITPWIAVGIHRGRARRRSARARCIACNYQIRAPARGPVEN